MVGDEKSFVSVSDQKFAAYRYCSRSIPTPCDGLDWKLAGRASVQTPLLLLEWPEHANDSYRNHNQDRSQPARGITHQGWDK